MLEEEDDIRDFDVVDDKIQELDAIEIWKGIKKTMVEHSLLSMMLCVG